MCHFMDLVAWTYLVESHCYCRRCSVNQNYRLWYVIHSLSEDIFGLRLCGVSENYTLWYVICDRQSN